MLTARSVRMSEHADGEATDLPPATVQVMLDKGHRDRVVAHHRGLIALAGRLEVGRAEDPSGRVSWVRLRLDPKSIADDGLDGPPDEQPPSIDHRPSTPPR